MVKAFGRSGDILHSLFKSRGTEMLFSAFSCVISSKKIDLNQVQNGR